MKWAQPHSSLGRGETFCLFIMTQLLDLEVKRGSGILLGHEYHIARGDEVRRTSRVITLRVPHPAKHTHPNKKIYLRYNLLPIQHLSVINLTWRRSGYANARLKWEMVYVSVRWFVCRQPRSLNDKSSIAVELFPDVAIFGTNTYHRHVLFSSLSTGVRDLRRKSSKACQLSNDLDDLNLHLNAPGYVMLGLRTLGGGG